MPKKSKKQYIEDDTDYKVLFDIFDEEQTGKILIEDLERMLTELEEPVDKKKIEKVLSEYQTKDDKEIDYDEFLEFLRRYHLLNNSHTPEEVIAAFQAFDRNNQGFISMQEFRHILTNLGRKFTTEEVDELFKDADLDQDGKLNYEEFVTFWSEQ